MDFHTALGKMSSYSERHTSLRRPHDSNSSTITAQTLISKIKSIQCDIEDDESIDACFIIVESLINSRDSSYSQKIIADILFKSCLGDSNLIRPTALFLAKTLVRFGSGFNNNFRSSWIEMMQGKYESRNDLFQESFETFLNVVSIHGETYNSFVIATEKLTVLGPPLIEYLEMTLRKGTEDAFKMLIMQLMINGKSLKSIKEYEDLQANIRKEILLNPSPYLLLAIDLTDNFFQLDGEIQKFYKAQLKDSYSIFECRAKCIPFCSENVDIKKLSVNSLDKTSTEDQHTVSNISFNSTTSAAVGAIPNVLEVRERMRAKGILPRKSSTPKKNNLNSSDEHDDDFYGLQLPKSKTLDNKASDLSKAKTVALPNDEWD